MTDDYDDELMELPEDMQDAVIHFVEQSLALQASGIADVSEMRIDYLGDNGAGVAYLTITPHPSKDVAKEVR